MTEGRLFMFDVGNSQFCNSHSFIVGQPIKATYSGWAGPNYIVNCDFLFVLSRAL